MSIRIGIIGLGTIGKFILEGALAHRDFSVVAVFDIARPQLPGGQYADIAIEASASALVRRPDVDLVYIGTPPSSHIAYCRLVLEANKALWCEKPLAICVEDAEALVEDIEKRGTLAAVNLSLASSPAIAKLETLIAQMPPEDILSVEMQFHYSAWPRHWQQDASKWLSSPQQGGFLREVFSHFVFMHQRLLGRLELIDSRVEYEMPQACESYVHANYQTTLITKTTTETTGLSRQIPVRVNGQIGGKAPDKNEWILYGKLESIVFSEWHKLMLGNEAGWQPVAIDAEAGSVTLQLNEVARMMAGQPHRLASFGEALEVQKVVEATLAST